MPALSPDIADKASNGNISHTEFNQLLAAIKASLDEATIAALVGDGKILYVDENGDLAGFDATPATPATVEDILAGINTGDKPLSAKNLADVGLWQAAAFASGTLTLNFSLGLRKYWVPTANVTTITPTLDERHTGIFEVAMGATPYTFVFPAGMKIPQFVQDTGTRTWSPAANKTYYLIFHKRGSTFTVLISDTTVVAA